MFIWILLLFIICYAIGCFHGSLAAQALSGVNVKKEGVKNSGASNAAIVLGWKHGVLVAFIDISKGFAAVAGLRLLLDSSSLSPEMIWTLLFIAGAGVISGHNFPFYMNFNGGKVCNRRHAGPRLEAWTGWTALAHRRFARHRLFGHWRTGALCGLFYDCFWPCCWTVAIADSPGLICDGGMEA